MSDSNYLEEQCYDDAISTNGNERQFGTHVLTPVNTKEWELSHRQVPPTAPTVNELKKKFDHLKAIRGEGHIKSTEPQQAYSDLAKDTVDDTATVVHKSTVKSVGNLEKAVTGVSVYCLAKDVTVDDDHSLKSYNYTQVSKGMSSQDNNLEQGQQGSPVVLRKSGPRNNVASRHGVAESEEFVFVQKKRKEDKPSKLGEHAVSSLLRTFDPLACDTDKPHQAFLGASENLANDGQGVVNLYDQELDVQRNARQEELTEDSIYDSVNSETGDTLGGDFEVVPRDRLTRFPPENKREHGVTLTGGPIKTFAQDVNHEWKRRTAKMKSRALKRTGSNKGNGNHGSMSHHGQFDDPHKGAIPAVTEEQLGDVTPFAFPHSYDSDSNISDFSDSTFDSFDEPENDEGSVEFDPNKPLPAEPKKNHHQIKDLATALLPINKKKETFDDPIAPGRTLLQRVEPRRSREIPMLPETQENLTPEKVKLRGVLQNLIESELSYVNSLERLTNDYKDEILSQVRKPEVKVTFSKVEDIYNLHIMFQIALTEKMQTWNQNESIGSIFSMFSNDMTRSIYSEYVNNYEAASEMIKEVENNSRTFKELLLRMQMNQKDRLSLSGLMLKPVQRFPQFIMIIKDLLKHTPRDHHDRELLQEAFTCIENVTHELNESKRQSEQLYHGQQIMATMAKGAQEGGRNVYLIRQDDMEQLSQSAVQGKNKDRRLFLMNDRIISVHVLNREVEGHNSEKRMTFKWQQRLEHLELTSSAITPNMLSKMDMKPPGVTISSPKTATDGLDDDPYSVAEQLTDMMHDLTVLAKIHQLHSTLRMQHEGFSEDHINRVLISLQNQIQGKDYQLQMLNSSAIIIMDTHRKKKYVFTAANAAVKQEWCIDFLMAKHALDIVNIPSWYRKDREGSISSQPALLIKHMTIDMQRTFTKIKCGVRVYFPTQKEGSVEHLWLWSSSPDQGQVSVVSLHTTKPALIESFQATKCDVVTAEGVPGFAIVKDHPTAFAEDTVWTSTEESKIQVFSLKESDQHRKPVHVFDVGCVVIAMKYVDDHVFCGNRSGVVIVYFRDDDGIWSEVSRVLMGMDPVNSMICVGDKLWAACGDRIVTMDFDNYTVNSKIDHQLSVIASHRPLHFNQLVKAGVGVWTSFRGQPNMALYHCETHKLLAELNICTAINDFISVYTGTKTERRDYEITCLMASLGVLWVGTNVGVILAYPLPRLRDGVPRIHERPQVALHSHFGPVRFLIPVQYGPITGTPIRRGPESVLVKYKVQEDIIAQLPKAKDLGKSGSISRTDNEDGENVYEEIGPLRAEQRQQQRQALKSQSVVQDDNYYESYEPKSADSKDEVSKNVSAEVNEKEKSSEHTYFILEKQSDLIVSGNGVMHAETSVRSNVPQVYPSGYDVPQISYQLNSGGKTDQVASDDVFKPTDRMNNDAWGSSKESAPENFKSELEKKVLARRRSLDDLIDRDADDKTVEMLYPTLVRPKTVHGMVNTDSSENVNEESLYIRPNTLSPIRAKKPDMSSFRYNKSSSKHESQKAEKVEKSETKPKKRVSIAAAEDMSSKQKKQNNYVGTSFSKGSQIDTLRKTDTNTIMVLSGGDGYKDWKRRQALPNYRPEEACLIFWMYKF